MKCKNCGAKLTQNGGIFICSFCGSEYTKEEIMPTKEKESSEFNIVGGVLISYLGCEENVVIPDNVFSIGESAFKNNLSIKSVTLGNAVNTIENNAFEGCVNLREISNYEKVSTFKEECFKGAGLERLTIGNSVTYLGKYCFSYMPNLVMVKYMPSKTLKHNHTFYNCKRLLNVEMDDKYFFPSFRTSLELTNNPNNTRPTYADAFIGTPFSEIMKKEVQDFINKKICIDCGGTVKEGLFSTKCKSCGIVY